MIQNIEIKKLNPHYNNPRKDLGDLTELAESIKVNGIFQNLTVVPWFSKITDVGCDDPKQQEEMGYIVVIGHRRLAAAKLAGLTEVPCAISNMSLREQVATMLLENMQRSDLTLWEQAQGFQMMLNLGDSVSDISGRTGFSETTVRRRVKLLELDGDKFKKSVDRGATLMDYAELEKIHDKDLRNSVLDKIGTSNFKWELQNAIDKEAREKNIALMVVELEKFAKQVKDSNGLQWFTSFNNLNDIKAPDDADTVEYFFSVSQYGYITLYKKQESHSQTNPVQDKKEKERQERHTQLDEITKIAYQLRKEFINEFSNARAKKYAAVIMEYAVMSITSDDYYSTSLDTYTEEMGYVINNDEDEELKFDSIAQKVAEQPERHLLIATYLTLENSGEKYYDWQNKYNDRPELNMVYTFLEKLGYELSDEEKSLRNGTHELLEKEKIPA
jgi:ParB family chromosome partitioning protein